MERAKSERKRREGGGGGQFLRMQGPGREEERVASIQTTRPFTTRTSNFSMQNQRKIVRKREKIAKIWPHSILDKDIASRKRPVWLAGPRPGPGGGTTGGTGAEPAGRWVGGGFAAVLPSSALCSSRPSAMPAVARVEGLQTSLFSRRKGGLGESMCKKR